MTHVHRDNPEFVEDQREFFDRLVTEAWRAYEDPAWDAVRRREVALALGETQPRSVIDLGCGCGFHDIEFAEAGVQRIEGVDYSAKSIEVAQREYPHPRVERKVGNVLDLPPGDFDLAVSFQVLEHLRDPVAFLRACAEQVRPGGRVVACTPNRRRLQNRLLALRDRPPALLDPQHHAEYSPDDLRRLGREAGLAPLRVRGYGLSLVLPRLGWQVMPRALHLRLGAVATPVANGLCATYRVP